MKERIDEKIEEIEKFVAIIVDFIPENIEQYKRDIKTKAACEHYFEKIIEACEDLAFLLIRAISIKIPEKDESVFDVLSDNEIMGKDLAQKLKDAKGMRNIISHEYGEIDDAIVFDAIANELENDVIQFIEEVKKMKGRKPNES